MDCVIGILVQAKFAPKRYSQMDAFEDYGDLPDLASTVRAPPR